jgi:hypothetical protein
MTVRWHISRYYVGWGSCDSGEMARYLPVCLSGGRPMQLSRNGMGMVLRVSKVKSTSGL